ncbi:Fibronectin type III domain containing protein [Plasmodiophora brassicae]
MRALNDDDDVSAVRRSWQHKALSRCTGRGGAVVVVAAGVATIAGCLLLLLWMATPCRFAPTATASGTRVLSLAYTTTTTSRARLVTAEHLAVVRDIEARIRRHPACACDADPCPAPPPATIVNYAYPTVNGTAVVFDGRGAAPIPIATLDGIVQAGNRTDLFDRAWASNGYTASALVSRFHLSPSTTTTTTSLMPLAALARSRATPDLAVHVTGGDVASSSARSALLDDLRLVAVVAAVVLAAVACTGRRLPQIAALSVLLVVVVALPIVGSVVGRADPVALVTALWIAAAFAVASQDALLALGDVPAFTRANARLSPVDRMAAALRPLPSPVQRAAALATPLAAVALASADPQTQRIALAALACLPVVGVVACVVEPVAVVVLCGGGGARASSSRARRAWRRAIHRTIATSSRRRSVIGAPLPDRSFVDLLDAFLPDADECRRRPVRRRRRRVRPATTMTVRVLRRLHVVAVVPVAVGVLAAGIALTDVERAARPTTLPVTTADLEAARDVFDGIADPPPSSSSSRPVLATVLQQPPGDDDHRLPVAVAASVDDLIVRPGAPTSLSAIPVGTTAVEAHWSWPAYNGSSPIASFALLYRDDDGGGGGPWRVYDAGDADNDGSLARIVGGLRPATSYALRVVARNAAGFGVPSDAVPVATFGLARPAPPAPTGLRVAYDAAANAVNVTWAPGAANASFTLEMRSAAAADDDDDDKYSVVYAGSAPGTRLTMPACTGRDAVRYWFRVRASPNASSAASAPSAPVAVVGIPDRVPLAPPRPRLLSAPGDAAATPIRIGAGRPACWAPGDRLRVWVGGDDDRWDAHDVDDDGGVFADNGTGGAAAPRSYKTASVNRAGTGPFSAVLTVTLGNATANATVAAALEGEAAGGRFDVDDGAVLPRRIVVGGAGGVVAAVLLLGATRRLSRGELLVVLGNGVGVGAVGVGAVHAAGYPVDQVSGTVLPAVVGIALHASVLGLRQRTARLALATLTTTALSVAAVACLPLVLVGQVTFLKQLGVVFAVSLASACLVTCATLSGLRAFDA